MTRPYWAHLFERFQNLNLIVLIEDLRRKHVAIRQWVERTPDGRVLCPLWHGSSGCYVPAENPWAVLGYEYGIHQASYDARNFVSSWDRRFISPNHLEDVLLDILRERLEDADAVQDMLAGSQPSADRQNHATVNA